MEATRVRWFLEQDGKRLNWGYRREQMMKFALEQVAGWDDYKRKPVVRTGDNGKPVTIAIGCEAFEPDSDEPKHTKGCKLFNGQQLPAKEFFQGKIVSDGKGNYTVELEAVKPQNEPAPVGK